ncbi:autotransporter domain-containing protein [Microbulbifer sp. CAU 1566]|uniref:autotransporter outer membrane beta-barrel domain-containing protein n=1 Tax=Microbulbifer sp. CAU 1566 TaxID=2933269 RepID=UPI0020045BC6|nr:autotransporter domain-containing protein [Microbulbifer sp. CAU 1566]MCK7598293.1 autotransporter domain-containing protein [Microbulbifer sp. CAU 1566]
MPNAKRSLAAAIAVASLTSGLSTFAQASADDSPFSQVIAFGDSLTDVGNAGVFTSGDSKQAAISLMSQNLGLGPVAPSCAGMYLCLPEVDPTLSEEQLLASAQAQVRAALPNVGGGWAVGGHRAADVLLNILGTHGYLQYLDEQGLTLNPNAHNFASALLPDPTRETSTGLYADLTLLGLLLQGPDAVAQLRAGAAQAEAQGDATTAAQLTAQADGLQAQIDAAPAAIVADSGSTGNPHPLGLGYLETNSGRADGQALYWVNGGGNDLLAGFTAALSGTITAEQFGAQAGLAASMLADGAEALSNAGANYILVSNVPDISSTPGMYAAVSQAVAASPEAAQLADAVTAGLMTQEQADAQLAAAIDSTLAQASGAVTLFNNTLLTDARDIDGVLMVDMEGILKVTLENAAAMGFSTEFDQSTLCYDGGSCIEHPVYGKNGSAPDASKLVFNDAVHPTQAAQAVLADYYTAVVNAAQVAGQLPDMGLQASRSHVSTLEESFIGSRYRTAETGVFVSGVFGNSDYDNSLAPTASGDASGSLIGAGYALRDNVQLGFAVSRSDLSLDNSQSNVDSTSTNYSLYSRFHHNEFFVDASVTMTDVDYDRIGRQLQLGNQFNGTLEAATSGENTTLDLTGGLNISAGDSRFGPFAGVTKVTAEVDGYGEDAMDGFTYTGANGEQMDPFGMNFGSQERRYTTMRLGAFADKAWGKVSAYGQVWYEDTTGTENDSLEVGVKSMTGNMNAMPSYASKDTGLFEDGAGALLGLRWQAADAIAVSANLTARPSSEQGSLNVTYRF